MQKLSIKSKYGVTPNSLLYNPEISAKAKGLFCYIQSKSENWDFSVERIGFEMSDGRDSIRSGILELEKFGYLERVKSRGDKGEWDTEWILYDTPTVADQPQRVSRGGGSAVGLPADGKPVNNSKQEYPNKNTKQDTTETIAGEKIYRKFSHLKISQKEFDALIEMGIPKTDIDSIIDEIENYRKNTNYKSLNLTIRSWHRLRKEKSSAKKENTPSIPNRSEYDNAKEV